MSKRILKGFTTIKLVIVTAICIILFMIVIPVITMKADVKIDFNKYAANKEDPNVSESNNSENIKVEEEIDNIESKDKVDEIEKVDEGDDTDNVDNIENTNNEININTNSTVSLYITLENRIEEIELEEYVCGVLANAMPISFEPEALKAQAIVVRSYVVSKKLNPCMEANGGDICDSAHCQVYSSKDDIIKKWGEENGDRYWEKIKNAVDDTKGKVLTYDSELVMYPLYFSVSSGKTESAEELGLGKIPYLKSVDSPGDEESSKFESSKEVTLSDLAYIIRNKYPKSGVTSSNIRDSISILSRSKVGGVIELKVGDSLIKGSDFKVLLGLNSINFDYSIGDNTIIFNCKGNGEGVGMSQWGANVMAKDGKSYDEILKHYYTGINIGNLKFNL